MMVAWPVRLAETGTGILRRRVVEAAFHGGDDGVVARAAAEFPGVPSADLLAGNGLALVFFDEGRTAHDEAGRAEAALDGPGVHIGLLDAGKPVALGFALGGADRFSVRPDGEENTGIHGDIVDEHGARAAFAHAAALFGAGQAFGAQDFEQRGADVKGKFPRLAVDGAAYGFQHEAAS